MKNDGIRDAFRRTVCADIDLIPEGVDRFQVLTPFRFPDGDHFVIILKRQGGPSWMLTDEGHTFMHLSYDMDVRDLEEGNRREIIAASLGLYAVSERQGEIFLEVPGERFGDALFNLIQALMKVSDVAFLSRERVRSTFLEDFRAFIRETVPPERFQFDWHDPQRDPAGKYKVDCLVNRMQRPIAVYALSGDDKVKDANIVLLTFETWNLPHHSIGIFEEQEQINRRVLARFTDVCDKVFSSLSADTKPRIGRYVHELIETPR
jgi:hypothetical protein